MSNAVGTVYMYSKNRNVWFLHKTSEFNISIRFYLWYNVQLSFSTKSNKIQKEESIILSRSSSIVLSNLSHVSNFIWKKAIKDSIYTKLNLRYQVFLPNEDLWFFVYSI